MFIQIIKLSVKGCKALLQNPLPKLLTLSAVTLVAFLTGLFLMGLSTFDKHLNTTHGESVYQVYWRVGTPESDLKTQWSEISSLPGFKEIKTYTPAEALEALTQKLRQNTAQKIEIPNLRNNNPLPPTALVTFIDPSSLTDNTINFDTWTAEIQQRLKNLKGVERVAVTPLRDELGKLWRNVSHFIFYPIVTFLFLVLALVVGNTVRLSLIEKIQEVEILHLVGAYAWYIRLPLLASGALLGFMGGFLALILLYLVHFQLRDILNFAPLYMTLSFITLPVCIILVLIPTFMGILGTWLATRKII
ncbi:cell division protein FtsX [Desulfovibrio litoralis]|uniref:Cell division protein FtsX n=1 Tax=Desulfovibrio litoralis DSM 11393 TaxID=1121455 RepID=A0A1M7TD46_9BACT|nr:permease-like cell division protein FtsX [Desulfovibrio litoralis]SHN68642.1 cell division protein FtsX [Desulfovibrio litoralis DSM 11393]